MEKLGAKPVPLDEIFKKSHVVSLNAPWILETEGMIQGRHFEMMRKGASFINTARGAIVDEPAMIAVLEKRRDMTAVLDVTWPEPPEKDSALFQLENVFMTPHIAGSLDDECRRMGKFAADELERYLEGEELLYRITEEKFNKMA
jgi:phosphoglycerate dehydrogenase-like enzyme